MDFEPLRLLAPLALAVAAAWLFDDATARRGLRPPGFASPAEAPELAPLARRGLAMAVLALVFWIGVFAPLGVIGLEQSLPTELETAQLFQLHFFFLAALVIWFALGFAGRRTDLAATWCRQFGLASRSVARELALGVGVGLGAWMAVLTTLILVGSLIYLLGGGDALPQQPPEVVVLVAGTPLWVRLAVSLSAGVVEELFFRGFLQPRTGIALSTGAFILAHASYEQPLMLVGVGMLSVIFALLVRWRQSIWAAIAAHAVFDGIQLLFVIPELLELLQPGAPNAAPIGL